MKLKNSRVEDKDRVDNFEEENLYIKKIFKIPILKVCKKKFICTFSLFGFIPFFKFRDFDSHYIFNILGFRVYKKHKSRFNYIKATEYGLSRESNNPRLIVSLTSYPARIKTTAIAINTLLNQTIKPDKLVLYLAESQFSNREQDLPKELLELTELGLEIHWCEDLKSYKKIIPALQEYPQDIIVTADDDLFYNEKWLESLYNAYLKDPTNIYVKRANKTFVDGDKIKTLPKEARYKLNFCSPSFSNQLLSGSGCLFPPDSLHEDIYNKEIFMSLASTQDDIYLWAMAVLKGTRIAVVDGFNVEMLPIDNTQDVGLCKINRRTGKGISPSKVFSSLALKYPAILDKIQREGING